MKSIDLIVPNPSQLQQLEFSILAVCGGYFSTGSCLRTATEQLARDGCPAITMARTGVSYFILPAKTKWTSPLEMEYPESATFRLTKLGAI